MRTVLRIRNIEGGTLIDLEEGVFKIPETFVPPLLTLKPSDSFLATFLSDAQGGGTTEAVGDKLFDAITAEAHLEKQIGGALLQNSPIYIIDSALAAQRLPWETLRAKGLHGNRFVGLANDLRFARMVQGGSSAAGERRKFAGELRILAVLAAAGGDPNGLGNPPLTALDEWKALLAMQDQLPAGLSLRVHVLGCDQDVKAAVEKAAAETSAGTKPQFTFAFLPPPERASAALLAAAGEISPHVVHFFCHGFAGDSPFLELATNVNQIRGDARGSVLLGAESLTGLSQFGTWLVVLNCCLGAAASERSQGLARTLVQDGEFPAVIGMQEPIDRRDAHRFSESFYGALLRHLGNLLNTSFVKVDLPKVVTEARQTLCNAHVQLLSNAGNSKPWSLPVLYLRPQSLELELTKPPTPEALAAQVAAEAEIATLSALLAELSQADTPPAVLEGIRQRIAALRVAPPGL